MQIDWEMVLHRAIFSWRNRKEIPAEYTALSMLISYLSKIGIAPMDEVIIKQLEERVNEES